MKSPTTLAARRAKRLEERDELERLRMKVMRLEEEIARLRELIALLRDQRRV